MSTYNPDLLDTAPGVLVPTLAARHPLALVYPPQGYDHDEKPDAIQVPAGAILEVQIDLGGSVKTIQQPHCVKTIADESLVPDFSCYTVSGKDGLPIAPREWREYGGKIVVEVNKDTVTATVRIYPAELPELAPFTIGRDDGANTFSTLYLLADAVALWRRTITLDTSLGDDEAAEDSTATLDNPYIQTLEQAWDAAHAALVRRLGNLPTLTLNVTGLRGIEGVDPDLPETALGRVAGSRIVWDGLIYRVRRVQHTPAGMALTCEQDVTFADVTEHLPDGTTFADVSTRYADAPTFQDFTVDPFRGGDLG